MTNRSDSFIRHYWRAYVWIALACLMLLGAVLSAVAFSLQPPNKLLQDLALAIVVGGVCVALTRFFINGGRFQSESRSGDTFNRVGENLVIWVIQAAIYTLVWPFIELFAQIRFLSRARSGWSRGEILVNEKNGRPLRSA